MENLQNTIEKLLVSVKPIEPGLLLYGAAPD
jgi:hypothetical protein